MDQNCGISREENALRKTGNPFEERQELQAPDFEVFHSFDASPIHVGSHSHSFCELLVFLSGNVTYSVEGAAYRLRPGDVMLIDGGEIHRPIVGEGKPYDRYVAWLSRECFRQAERMGGDLDPAFCFRDSARRKFYLLRPESALLQAIVQALENLTAVSSDRGAGRGILRNCYMGELLVCLNRAYLGTAHEMYEDIVSNEKIRGVISYINRNLCEPLTLDALSARFFTGKFYLTRLFERYTGLTLHQYIIKKRLTAARALLLQGCPATEACVNCGFGDYSHFSRSFREQYGVPPGKYRAQAGPERAAVPWSESSSPRANSSPMERENGGRSTPDSVTMAEMSPASVTSKAGL